MRTWAAAFTLLGVQFKELGLQGEEGVETNLRAAFAAAGKPVGQLETNGEQLGFFNALPEKAQRELLEGAIETPKAASGEFARMLAVWASGDVAGIAKAFNEQLAGSPELMDALIRRRNVDWKQWVQRRLAHARARCCWRSAPGTSPGPIRCRRCSSATATRSAASNSRHVAVPLSFLSPPVCRA